MEQPKVPRRCVLIARKLRRFFRQSCSQKPMPEIDDHINRNPADCDAVDRQAVRVIGSQYFLHSNSWTINDFHRLWYGGHICERSELNGFPNIFTNALVPPGALVPRPLSGAFNFGTKSATPFDYRRWVAKELSILWTDFVQLNHSTRQPLWLPISIRLF